MLLRKVLSLSYQVLDIFLARILLVHSLFVMFDFDLFFNDKLLTNNIK
jgi:hypothetical protein